MDLQSLARSVDADTLVLIDDTLRSVHLIAMAGGFGCVMAADLTMLRLVRLPVGWRHSGALEAAHRLIAPALVLAWASGLALAALRTGLDPSALSPKLATKLGVVTLLTLTALVIVRFVRPTFAHLDGYLVTVLPLRRKLGLALAAGLSVAGWGSALVLGSSRLLADAGWDLLLPAIGLIYGVVCGGLLLATLLAHRLAPPEPPLAGLH